MQAGKIDFGVISAPFQIQESYQIQTVRKIRDVFVVGEKYREYADRQMDFKDLLKIPYVCLEGQTSTKKYVTSYLKERDVVLQPELELANSDMLVSFVQKGFGVANIVEDFILEGEHKNLLFRLQFPETIPEREICVVYDKKYPLSASAKKMLEVMQKKI